VVHLRGQTPETLAAAFPGLPLPVARRVLHRVVGEDRDDLEGVRGLSKALLAELRARGRLERLEVVDRRRSEVDPFVKYLFRSLDGRVFEAVRIPLQKPRWSVCLSSQVGCALGCAFCETGRLGLARHLEPWEIVEQALTVRRESPERPLTGAVFQGQGEPFHNYDNVIQAARILRDPSGARIGSERIPISTVGLLPQIDRYTAEGHPYRLILSLTSAFSEKRARLVPATARHGVPDLAAAMRRHAAARGGPVSLAWVLISGWNSGADEARELARLFRGVPVRLSVIDVNDPEGRFARASDAERGGFLSALADHGLGFVRRYSGGPDIHAACGMLASRARGGAAHEPPAAPPS
jgi:23S rRNA (adenine2503-C2)-methyltransferase